MWILSVALLLSAISSVRQTHGYPELLFANRKDIRIIDVGKETRARQVIVKQEVSFAASVDYYYGGQLVCWTDIDNERIKCVQVAGSQAASQGVKDHREVTVITRGVVSPDGLAVDWLGEKLYWTDSDTNKVEVAGLYTKHRRVLFWQDLDQPRAIALVPQKGLMFWTDWGENPKIERAGMDGDPKTRKVIINSDIHWPNGLCVDYEESVIYWADAHLSYIASADFQGKKRTKVEVQLPHPFALTYFNHTLYWTDWETNAIHYCTINTTRQCEKQSKLGINLSPMYIHVYDPLRQKPYDTACQHNNGGCSHLCLASLSPRNYTCACPTGVKLIDEYNCAPGPELMLILARREDLRLISLDTPDHTAVVLPVSGVKHAIAVDYDPVDKFIYWTDDEALSIQRARADGSEQEIIVSAEVKNPDGVAVDWVARNLYWTDTGPDRIEVARLNGTSRKIVIAENLDEPRAIAVDPDGGLMFWTDWGQRPKIERAALDGSQRKVIINTELGWPNGVAIDQDMKKVYWCDAKTDKIEEADFDGSLRRVVLNDRLPHVFGFSLLGDFLYWTDWQGRSIERLHKFTGGQRSVIVDQLPDLMGLKAVNVSYRVGINPCASNNGGCSHLCLNRPNNNFTCGCPIGYELTTNGEDCVVPEAFLLYTRKEDIRRISLLTTHNVPIPVSGIKEAIAIDFDSVDNRLYWTDISVKSISRAFMNGSQLEKVIEFGLEFPEGMAVDWLARNIYWADMGNNRIEVARLDGTSRRVLLWQNINNPHSLALNPSQGFMYWTEWGDQPRISRAQLDASKPRVIVTDMGRANGLTVDFKDNRLFWIDIDFNRIESSDLDGKNKEILVGDLPQPYSLTLYEDYVYWADWKSGSIERANKTNGQNRTKIQGELDYIVDLLVFHSSRQSGQNPCISNNGGCSHLCLAVPQVARTQSTDSSVGSNSPGGAVIGAHTCSCPTHYKLDKDEKTCHAPMSFLLFSQKSVVSRLMEDARECPTLILPIHNIRNVKAIDYDPTDQLVYWVDGRSHSIRRAHHNGSTGNGGGGGGQVFVSNHDENIHPYDIAVEPFTRVVLWSCARNNIINVTRLDGEQVGGIIGGGDSSDQPRSLAVHPVLGLVMFINLVVPPRIEQARLDGQQRREIISSGLDDPQALAIDHQEDLIFWADSRRIETATIHGDNRKVLVDAGIEQPVGLAVHEDFVYWVDRELNLIERVNKFSGQQREKVQGRISHLSDIIAVTPHLKQGMLSHPCHNGSECSHLCLRADRDQRCACPQGKTLASDLKTCMNLPSCEPDQFRCHSGSVPCIPLKWKCDDRPECEDKSDEENCPQKPCQPNKHRCSNNQCIEKYQVCDGVAQCDDGSDEVACCDEGKIMCVSTGVCEPMTVVCSGRCPDNYDKGVCSLVKLPIDSPGPGKAPYIVGVVASVLVLVCVVALVLYYRRRPSLLDDHELEPTPAKHLQQRQPYRVTMCGKVYHGIHGEGGMVSGGHPGMGGIGDRGVCIGAAFNNPGAGNGVVSAVSGGLFERTPVTGASSSSSSMTHYPRETINPPPTPIQDARPGASSSCQPLCCHVPHQGPTPAALHSYRHYKTRNRPPPPTPCSTDVQDDSDFNSSVGVFSHVTPGGCYTSPGSTTYYSSPQMTDYDSDPHPPPPTPQYLNSCPPTSYPPSPSTDRSYCTRAAPCPPPPSPIASD